MNFLIIFIIPLFAQEYLCETGDLQSPIDISEYLDSKYYKLELRFKDDYLTAQWNQDLNLYQFTEDLDKEIPEFRILGSDAKGLMVGYKPKGTFNPQLVLPSDHQIDGKAFDGELQIWGNLLNIYKNPYVRGELSIFFEISDQSDSIFEFTESTITLNMVNIASILGKQHKYFTYRGSDLDELCSEHVNKFIIPEPLKITETEYDLLVELQNFNKPRELQDVHKRPIKRGTLTIYDQTSAHFSLFDRYLSLGFIALLFALIFALFIKEQRQKAEQARRLKSQI